MNLDDIHKATRAMRETLVKAQLSMAFTAKYLGKFLAQGRLAGAVGPVDANPCRVSLVLRRPLEHRIGEQRENLGTRCSGTGSHDYAFAKSPVIADVKKASPSVPVRPPSTESGPKPGSTACSG